VRLKLLVTLRHKIHRPIVASSWLISSSCCPWLLCFRLSDNNFASWLFRSYCCFSSRHLHGHANRYRVLTNLAKWNSLSFPDLLNSLFQTIIKWKTDVTNHRSSQFDSFLAELQNILLKEHGDWLHPCQSLCHSTNLCYCYWQLCTQLDAQEILSYNNQQHLINSPSKF